MARQEYRPATPARPASILALSITLGTVWMALELALTFASGRVLDAAQTFEHMLRLLPWQLTLFAGIGVAVALLARWRGLGLAAAGWAVVCAASFTFLGESMLEGLLRKGRPVAAAGATLGLALLLLGLATAALAAQRRLPHSWARSFTPAVWTAWSLFFLLWMQHASTAIRLWEPGPQVLVEYLRWQHLGVGLVAGAVVWIAGRLAPAGGGAALLALAMWTPLALPGVTPAAGAGGHPDRPHDVLVILIDTLRFDHLGANVGVAGLTPELDALAHEAVLFTRAFSPGNFTKLAVPGIHASLPYRVTWHPLPDEVTTLAEHLKAAGYATYGLSANPYVGRRFGYAQGFDVFLDPMGTNEFLVESLLEAVGRFLPGLSYRLGIVHSDLYYVPAAVVRQRAREFFEDSPGRTFVYLQTMDPHGPYLPPHRYLPDEFHYDAFESYFTFDHWKGRGLMARPEYAARLENLRQRYRGEVRFTDEELGGLVRDLKAAGRWDESLVVVLSDHGEAFGENDWAGHSGRNVSRTLVQVPFLVKPPRSWAIPARAEEALVSTYDLLPTVLSLLGLPEPPSLFGRDLSGLILGEPAGERTVVSFGLGPGTHLYTAVRWPWKLDLELDRDDGSQVGVALYDLEADPGELVDVAAAHPARVQELTGLLLDWRAREDRAALGGGAEDVDPLVLEQLRKLGYAE